MSELITGPIKCVFCQASGVVSFGTNGWRICQSCRGQGALARLMAPLKVLYPHQIARPHLRFERMVVTRVVPGGSLYEAFGYANDDGACYGTAVLVGRQAYEEAEFTAFVEAGEWTA